MPSRQMMGTSAIESTGSYSSHSKKKCTSIQAGQNYKSNIFSRDENLTS
jgi:hypothetical protein